MKLRILASAAALGLLAAPAYAQVSDTVEITGGQEFTCVLNLDNSTASLTVDFPELDDGDGTGIAAVMTQVTGEWDDSYCNGPHKISLASTNGGLITAVTAAANSDAFDTRVDYTASISTDDWGAAVSLTTTGTPNEISEVDVNEAFRNDANGANTLASDGLKVTVATLAGTNPLLQGGYADTLTLELSAQ